MAFFEVVRQPSATWSALNPTLLPNQLGIETNIVNNVETGTSRAKLGNGIDKWSALPYWNPAGAQVIKGVIDCSSNPDYPAALQGDMYVVSVGGKIGGDAGVTVTAGNLIYALADNPGGSQASVGDDWSVIETEGAVVGPASSTDHAIARWDGTTGQLLQNSVVTIDDTTGSINGARSISLSGATSGAVNFVVPAEAGDNTITWPAGTTDFSATGGAGQVVQQSTAGGALTVAALTPSEVGVPFTPASASGPASLAFAEDTDDGAHAVTVKAPATVTANVDVTLPDAAGTVALIAQTVTNGETTSAPSQDAIYDNYGIPGIKKYRALLTQSSTDAPVPTVLENSLGAAVVWTYVGPGTYIGTLVGAFTANKTFPVIATPLQGNGVLNTADIAHTSADVLTIVTRQIDAATPAGNPETDGLLNATPVEILVYP